MQFPIRNLYLISHPKEMCHTFDKTLKKQDVMSQQPLCAYSITACA